MRKYMLWAWYAVVVLGLASPSTITAQGTPEAEHVAESDALWGGNAVDQLPSCEGEELCLAVLSQSDRTEWMYQGIIQNNTQDWVRVRKVVVTLFDTDGEVAAIAGVYDLSPRAISPGGHALILVQAAGEFVSEFSFETRFDYDVIENDYDGDGMPLEIESATLRGNAILGEFTNPWDHTIDNVTAYSVCLADDGTVLDWNQYLISSGPYETGDGDRLVFTVETETDLTGEIPKIGESDSNDCSNFVVMAHGR